jgi:hypothetical protein
MIDTFIKVTPWKILLKGRRKKENCRDAGKPAGNDGIICGGLRKCPDIGVRD